MASDDLEIVDLKVCSGPEVQPHDHIVVLYKVALSTEALVQGNWVESTYQPDIPVEFRMDEGELLPGVYYGLLGMRAGGSIRRLTIPPVMAYGERGAPGILPGATLHVELCLARISRRD